MEVTRTQAWLIDEVHLPHETNLSRLRKVAVLANAQKLIQEVKENEETGEYVLNKRTKSISRNCLNELGISDLFYIEYKSMEIKMLTKVRRIMY